jgi:hypothetical protein
VRRVAAAWLVLAVACDRERTKPPPSSVAAPSSVVASNPAPALEASPYPVRWSPELRLESLSQLDARQAADDVFGELELGEQRSVPRSCRQWAALHASGYEPSTTIEAQPDLAATLRCGILSLLEHARPARSSWVCELRLDTPDLASQLPALLATAESNEEVERRRVFAKAGQSLAELDPRARLVDASADRVTIVEGGGQSSILLRAEAWGDFDGDGREDVALGVINARTRGTLSSARVIVVTRARPADVFRVLDESQKAPAR